MAFLQGYINEKHSAVLVRYPKVRLATVLKKILQGFGIGNIIQCHDRRNGAKRVTFKFSEVITVCTSTANKNLPNEFYD